MRGSRNVRQGGPGQSDKKSSDNVFLSPQLILSNGQFQRNISFFQGGGGGPTFSRVESNDLCPIETHITCDCPVGPGPLSPPSGSALARVSKEKRKAKFRNRYNNPEHPIGK